MFDISLRMILLNVVKTNSIYVLPVIVPQVSVFYAL